MKRVLLALLLLVLVGVPGWVVLSARTSLDHDFRHSAATAALPVFDAAGSRRARPVLSRVVANGMTFRVRSAGFGGTAGNVLLLHGFPESSAMYEPMIPLLAEAGYQVVAFDQRGYSPGARPVGVDAYAVPLLVDDLFAVADAVGFDSFHLVGHDWGAAVGWQAVFDASPRLKSWSALSIPHLGAYGEALRSDEDQRERSAYLGFFALPWLAETLFAFDDFAAMRTGIYAEHRAAIVEEYLAIFSEPGALTAALSWYRATGIDTELDRQRVAVPTAYVWGNEDPVVGAKALELQSQHFDAELVVTELDTGHWLLETEAEAVTQAVLEHLLRHP